MQPANRADTLADIGDAADTVQMSEPLTLLRIFCHEDDFVNNLFKGANQPLNEGSAFIYEEVLLLPVGTPGFPTYENYR